jgi:hypothetical protein
MAFIKKPACDLKQGERFSYVGGFGVYQALTDAVRCNQIPTKVVIHAYRSPRYGELEPRRLRVRLDFWRTVSPTDYL